MKHIQIVAIIVLAFIALALAGIALRFGAGSRNTTSSASFQIAEQNINPQVAQQPRVLESRAFVNLGLPIRQVTLGDEDFSLSVADTKESRVAGLSNVDSMQYYDGMLFVFETASTHGFWMKDMRFPLDIIWLDETGKIVHIEEQLSPDTYPRVFKPAQPARYVIELNAGVVAESNIAIGDQISLFGQEVAAPASN